MFTEIVLRDQLYQTTSRRGDMKRTKRISIEFLHREITIAVSNSKLDPRDDKSETGNAPPACSTCGSPWMTIVELEGGNTAPSVTTIHRALRQYGLHLHVSADGQLSICRRSFEQIKEKL